MIDQKKLLQYENSKKSILVAYLLYICFGGLQVHRFYAGSKGIGIFLLLCPVMGAVSMFVASSADSISIISYNSTPLIAVIGLVLFAIWGLSLFIDIFYIPSMVKKTNNKLLESL